MVEQKREIRARVNGDLVGRAPRSRVDKSHWNEDIAWLLNESRGELGAQGMSIDPSGGGSRDPSNTEHLHERRWASMDAVKRWRRLRGIWDALAPEHQRVLTSRYAELERQHSETRGLEAAFGDLRGLAWAMGQELSPKLALRILRLWMLTQRRARVIPQWEARFKWENLALLKTGKLEIGDYLRLHPSDEQPLIDAAASDLRARVCDFKKGNPDPVIRALDARAKAANRAAHRAWMDVEQVMALTMPLPPRTARSENA